MASAYRFRKFVRRNRVLVIASVTVLLTLLAGVTGTSIGLIGQSRQRATAEHRTARKLSIQAAEAKSLSAMAEAIARFQADMLASANPANQGDKVTVLADHSCSAKELDAGKLSDQPLVEAFVRATIGNTLRSLGRYDLAEPNLRKSLELRRESIAQPAAR